MNSLLKINQKVLVIIFLIFLIIFGYLLFDKKNSLKQNEGVKNTLNFSYDILKPKFTINNTNQNISVTANEGNFIDTNKILLKKNVFFKSNKFLIKSNEVYFNKKDQSAFSDKNSIFISSKTNINAEGFKITDKGNKILFSGKIKVILNKSDSQ